MANDVVSLFPDVLQPVAWGLFFAALFGAAVLVFYKKLNSTAPGNSPSILPPDTIKALGIAINNDMAQREMSEALVMIAKNAAELKAIQDKALERDITRWNAVFERIDRLCDRLESIQLRQPPRRG